MNNNLNILIWYPSLEHMGGIERVIVEHIRIFSQAGYNVHLVTEQPVERLKQVISCPSFRLDPKQSRPQQWKNIIASCSIHTAIFHGADFPTVQSDLSILKNQGVKTVLNIHFSFPSPILFNDAHHIYSVHAHTGPQFDAIATVSHIDAIWWRALCLKAFHVQNPFVRPSESSTKAKKSPHSVLWVGRMTEPKLPSEAIHIFRRVVNEVPDAKLLMVGGSRQHRSLMQQIHTLGLERHVQLISEQTDITPFYQQSSVCLLTSITESFCLVLAEAKYHGLPVAMYDIPFLELVQDGKGLVSAPLWDRQTLAQGIIRMLTDSAFYQQQALASCQTLELFNDDRVLQDWRIIFDYLQSGKEPTCPETDPSTRIIVQEIVKAWNYHIDKNSWKIKFFDELEKLCGGLPKTLANLFMSWVIGSLRKLKHIVSK